jgi:peptidoglycan biosynthesis protein MviN/MurJ (putative lipid II flippase)
MSEPEMPVSLPEIEYTDDRDKSPRRGMAAAILVLQGITLGLTTPVMISLGHISTGVAVTVGVGLCLICILLSGMLRRKWAYGAGWLVQVASLVLAIWVHMMLVLGIVFLALWWGAMALASKIEREKAAAYAEYDRLQANG